MYIVESKYSREDACNKLYLVLGYSHVLLLVVHGDDKAGQLGGHVGPDAGEGHLQDVDRTTVDKVLHGEEENKLNFKQQEQEILSN